MFRLLRETSVEYVGRGCCICGGIVRTRVLPLFFGTDLSSDSRTSR